jgi:hypothetical protein
MNPETLTMRDAENQRFALMSDNSIPLQVSRPETLGLKP